MILREQRFAGLGIGSLSGGEITAAAAARSLAVLEEFALLIRPLGIDPATARVLGTSALRHAGNAAGFAGRVREKTGFRIRIISGEEEAGLIRAGVRASGVLDDLPFALVVDIGGGSVECILFRYREPVWLRSFEAGGIRLLDRFRKSDPMDEASAGALCLYLEETLQPLWEQIARLPEKPVLVGSAGSFETLTEMAARLAGKEWTETRPWYTTGPGDLLPVSERILQSTLNERLALPGMVSFRADMIPAAVLFIRTLLPRISPREIRVSGWSLKEGALVENWL